MKNAAALPHGYCERARVDLRTDPRQARIVSGAAVVIAAVLAAAGAHFVPLRAAFSGGHVPLKLAAALAGAAAGVVLHELVHGVFIRLLGGVKPRYGFTGRYACAGSGAYFCKRDYIVIALAPAVLLGLSLALAAALAPAGWFWSVYIVQIVNLSGAAGDYCAVCRLLRLRGDLLIGDTGLTMIVYQKEGAARNESSR